jgi:cytochrome c biogenesis protein CcdA/glutaredoxin
MRCNNRLLIAVLATFLLFSAGFAAAEFPVPPAADSTSPANMSKVIASSPRDHIVVYLFYNQHCGECQRALTFMEGFSGRHPDVVVRSFDIFGNPENQQLFQEFSEAYGAPFSPVPSVFIGSREISGFDDLQKTLDEAATLEAANLTAPGILSFPSVPSFGIMDSPAVTKSPLPGGSAPQANMSRVIASSPRDHVVVYLFYNQHCGECQKALTFMEGFASRHPEVTVRSFDIFNNPENQQLFQEFSQAYGVPFSSVPSAFVGNWEIMGYDDIEKRLDGIVTGEAANLTASSRPSFPSLPATGLTNSTRITVPIVIAAALIDGINPCAFSVMIFLLVTLMSVGSRRKMLIAGLVYTAAVFVFYFLSGLGLFAVVQISGISRIFATIAACVALVAGVIMIKEALIPGKGAYLVIPESKKGVIDSYVKMATLPAAFILGILVGLFELPCTGGVYLAILSMLSQQMTLMAGIPLLLLYNMIFVVPLLIILGIVYFGLPPERIEAWRVEHRFITRFAMGVMMIAIGVIVLVFAVLT